MLCPDVLPRVSAGVEPLGTRPSNWHGAHRWLGIGMLGLLLILSALPTRVSAEPIPWRRQPVDLPVSNEPLNVVLNRLVTLSGISASISAPVATAKVTGRLQGTAETIFRELADTYGLTWYYNGSLLYIYSLSEVDSRMLQVKPVDLPRVERTLREMRLLDPRFQLRSSATEGQLFVSGPPQYVQMVSDVAARVATAPSQKTHLLDTRVFKLRHARAADTVVNIGGVETTIPGVARILNEIMGAPRSDGAMASGNRTLPVTVPGLRGKGQVAVGRDPVVNGAAAAGAGSPQPPVEGAVDGMTARATTEAIVRADPRINVVIVRDMQDRMAIYERLIADLDISMPLLEIEATVIDVSHDKSDQLGVDWRLHGQRADVTSSPNGLAGTGSGAGTIANNLLYSLPARSSGTGLVGTLLFGSDRTNFIARINALTQNGDANLISKPRVLTLNNTEAVLQSTQDFYVRVAGRDQADLFNVSLGLTLRVTPTLVEDAEGSRVKLTIRIEDGNTNGGNTVDQIPVVNRNAISTQAVVGDGQSLLIGGYTIDQKSTVKSGVPVLSEMPGLRWLFGQKTTEARRVERMFMITPRLVQPGDIPGTGAPAASLTPSSNALVPVPAPASVAPAPAQTPALNPAATAPTSTPPMPLVPAAMAPVALSPQAMPAPAPPIGFVLPGDTRAPSREPVILTVVR